MSKQFENPNETKVEDETASNLSAKQVIDHVAEAAAVKAAKTVQKYDKENSNLFTK